MVRFDIDPQKTALIIIDMQNAFLKPGATLERPKGREIIARLNKLIRVCREARIMIVFTCQAFRADGSDIGLFAQFFPEWYRNRCTLMEGTSDVDIYQEIDRQPSDIIIRKAAYSAFLGAELDFLLRINGIDTLIIGGVDTAVCCEATARSARHRNYRVIFLSDGTATSDQPNSGWGAISADDVQRFVLTIMAPRYAEVLPVEEVLRRVQVKLA